MENIKKIEDMSLNAWPSHKMELYDGWILRFSYFYTHRTNSVEQFGNSTPTAKTSTSVSALRLSLKSVLLYHRILITHWKIVATKSNIRQRS